MKNWLQGRKVFGVRIISLCFLLVAVSVAFDAYGQSSRQNFPTPITTNEISGEIKARDIGDSRLTTYFYTFDGSQGDVFVNIVTRNFTGDIDIFRLDGLQPLTKVVVYADLAESETGRVIYLRKPENLLLRIQGRTPNDDSATYRIKFAGSFVASTRDPGPAEPELPKVVAENEAGIRVNSVGTIVEVLPKPTPLPEEVAAKPEEVAPEPETKADVAEVSKPAEDEAASAETVAEPEKKVEVVVTDDLPKETKAAPPAKRRTTRTARGRRTAKRTPPKQPKEDVKPVEEAPDEAKVAEEKAVASEPGESKPADPLANIKLVVLFKDGKKLERQMNEVFKFSVDKGVLTVISKDGRVGRYPLLDIAKVTIE